MSSSPPVLTVEALVARIPGHPDIRFADFALRPGELAVVRGPSGSGKSTLLHLLAGVFPLSATDDRRGRSTAAVSGIGRVQIAGRALQQLPARERERLRPHTVGWMPQRHLAIQSLSVIDNVLLPLSLSTGVTAEARTAAASLLQTLEIGDLALRRPVTLSVGQLARVCLARAVIASPAVLLVDEPTAALDDASAMQVARCLRDCATRGMAVVAASHDERLLNGLQAGDGATLHRLELAA